MRETAGRGQGSAGKGKSVQGGCGAVVACAITNCVPGQRRGALGHRGSLFGQVALPSECQCRALLLRAGPRPQGHHRSIAAETEIIKLLMRQFLTNKSVFETGFMVGWRDRVRRSCRRCPVMARGRRRVLVMEDDPETV